MNKYEELEQQAVDGGIPVVPYDFTGTKLKGLYCDRMIAISKDIVTFAEKSCILAEELGHHYTSYGDIIDMNNIANRKQEQRARLWAYNEQIGLTGIIKAYEHHCQSAHDIADYLDVPEDYLLEAISCYRQKYGMCTMIDNYVIYFSPGLGVLNLSLSHRSSSKSSQFL